MKLKIIPFFVLIFFFFQVFGEEIKSVTIDEAVSTALENNNLLKSAKSQIDKSKGAKTEAFSYHFPKLDLSLSYSRTDNPVYVFMGKLTQEQFSMMDFAIDKLNNPSPLTNYQGKVSLALPIFTGGKIASYNRAADFGIKVSENKYNEAKESVIKGVTQAFYGAILAEQAVKVYEEAVETAKAHEKQISLMHKEGLVLDSDLLRIRVYLKDVEQELLSRRADLEIARTYLAYAMGVDYPVKPEGDITLYIPVEKDLDSLIQIGEKQRGELIAMENVLNQAKEGVKIKKADYFPQVGLGASYERDYNNSGDFGKNWMVAVEVKIPIFDAGQRKGALLSAKADEISAASYLADLRLKTDLEIKEAYLKLKSSEEKIKVSESQLEQAKENQRIVAKRYEEGLALITELLDADITVTATVLSRTKAYYDALTQKAELARCVGGSNFIN